MGAHQRQPQIRLIVSFSRLYDCSIGLFVACVLLFCVGGQVSAQERFNPDHPVVEEMARAGARFLENRRQTRLGESVLSAMTIIEVSKRYDNEVPADNPVVRTAIGQLTPELAKVREGRESEIFNGSTYLPCLTIIFLCELDKIKYYDDIRAILNQLLNSQQRLGAYGYSPPSDLSRFGDSSQSQYIALALAVANLHEFSFDYNRAKNLLEWFCRAQLENGSWTYHYRFDMQPEQEIRRHSLHICGLSAIYVLGDVLNLNPKLRGSDSRTRNLVGLPPSVAVYVKPRDGIERRDGPRVDFDGQRLANVKQKAKRWMQDNFTFDSRHEWNYYYIYGFERYAYFREKSEGVLAEHPTWYDLGVDFLRTKQLGDGGFDSSEGVENRVNSTCFAVLFLVRSSQLLMREPNMGTVIGNKGFTENTRLANESGAIKSESDVHNLAEIMQLLQEEGGQTNFERINDSIGMALKEFQEKDGKSRGEQMAFLRGMVTDPDGDRRWFAVKILATQQDMDNVPALLFALSDPSVAVAREAHQGLRMTSRKMDAVPLPPNPTRDDFKTVKKMWEEWYLSVRPGAELWPDVED